MPRRTLHTGSDLLTDKQRQRLTALFADDEHVEVEASWGIYQHMIAAHREPDRRRGRELMQQLLGSISHSVPAALREVFTLGRTLKRRAGHADERATDCRLGSFGLMSRLQVNTLRVCGAVCLAVAIPFTERSSHR